MSGRDTEVISLLDNEPLVAAGRTMLGRNFPLGEGWYRMNLRFYVSIVIGTGTTPLVDGLLNFIKNITLKTSLAEVPVNLPARALQRIALVRAGVAPDITTLAAATAVYIFDIPILFADPAMMRPEDTILDTYRYNSMSLEITTGTVADLFGTVGTSTVSTTLDATVLRTRGQLPPEALPFFIVDYSAMPPVDAATTTSIDLERSDLTYKRLYVFASSAGTPGVVFSGAAADDVQLRENVRDQNGDITNPIKHELIQSTNKLDYGLQVSSAGLTVFDFVSDGSINTALTGSDKSRLQYTWVNKAGVAANDIVSLAYEGFRGLKSA